MRRDLFIVFVRYAILDGIRVDWNYLLFLFFCKCILHNVSRISKCATCQIIKTNKHLGNRFGKISYSELAWK